MGRHRYALALWICAAFTAEAMAQTSLTPEHGILVLRNGRVLEGEVTRAGDYYVVTQGTGIELRLKAGEVEAFCASLDEAYEFKRRHLAGDGVKPHLDLAEWCLSQNLHGRCAQELVAAMRLEPTSERLKGIENRLKLAMEVPPAPVEKELVSSATVSSEQLEQTMRALPKGSVEKFSTNIQPILLNRCAANQCHGPNAKSEFRLLRPPAGQVANRRFTQRNLYAVLKYVDQSNPEASPLVTLPQRRHGSALTAVFDKQTQNQLAELIAWSKSTLAAPPSAAPATIGPMPTTLSQPATVSPVTKENSNQNLPATGSAPGGKSVQTMKPPLDEGTATPAAAATRFVPRDRYDPEIFNRHYHGGN